MAKDTSKYTSGGGSLCMIGIIKTGSVSTTATEYMEFYLTKSSDIAELITKAAGKEITINSILNTPELTEFLTTNVTAASTNTPETITLENNTSFVAGSTAAPTLFFSIVGASQGGYVHTFEGCCSISIENFKMEGGKASERNIKLTTMTWPSTGSALTVPVGFYNLMTTDGTKKVYDVTGSVAITTTKGTIQTTGTTFKAGEACREMWYKAAPVV